MKADPESVSQLAARVVTGDPSITCDTNGCKTATGTVDLDELVSPTSSVLKAAGVTHGAWVARPDTKGALNLEVRVKGSKTEGATRNLRPDLGRPVDERPEPVVSAPGGGEILTAPDPVDPDQQITQETLDELVAEGGLTLPDSVTNPGPGAGASDGLAPDPGVVYSDPSAPGGPGLPSDAPSSVPYDGPVDPETPSTEPSTPPAVGNLSAPAPTSPAAPADPATPSTDPTSAEIPDAITESDVATDVPDVLVAGVAWGVVFPLSTPWFSAGDAPAVGAFGASRSSVTGVEGEPAVPAAPFTKGLSVDDAAATMLTPSQLTAWSSPTTGCGIGVVCAPTGKGVTLDDSAPAARATLCWVTPPPPGMTLDGGADLPSLTTPVSVVLRTRTFALDGTARIQLGAWPDDAATPAYSWWPVPVPTTDAPYTLQVTSAEIYDADGLVTMVGGQSLNAPAAWDTDTLLASGAGEFLRTC